MKQPCPLGWGTVYDGLYHASPPLGRCSMPDLSTVEIVWVPKRSTLKTSRGEPEGGMML